MHILNSFCFLGLLGLSLGIGVVQGTDAVPEADAAGSVSIQMMYEGYHVVFYCNFTGADDTTTVSAKPEASIKLEWFKDEEPIVPEDRIKVFQENSTLLILDAERSDVGNYTCKTETGDDVLSKTIMLIFVDLRRMEKSQNVDENQPFSMECPADGIPKPTIVWLKNQKPLIDMASNDSRITFAPNSKDIPNGTITIEKAEWNDRGNYSCVITTPLMSYERWTYLRVKDVYAALWPFIGIVVEVVILGIIIIIFEKRRAKEEFDESDTDQGNDQ